jgi:hypothetical protein
MSELFSGPSSPVVILFGTACVVCWLVAYIGIIHRGFKDRTFGMPIAALAANISWEAIYGFLFQPFGDYLHNLSIAWFFLDIPIAVQCWIWGAKDFTAPWTRRHFKLIYASAIAIAFPLVWMGFYELRDPAGEYTGFGINCMMSILFVAMLARRDSVSGQSMYVAIFKGLGTLLSFIATVLDALTDAAHPWPAGLGELASQALRHDAYPLTSMIKFLYLIVFCADALYAVVLYRKLRASNISPWKRF